MCGFGGGRNRHPSGCSAPAAGCHRRWCGLQVTMVLVFFGWFRQATAVAMICCTGAASLNRKNENGQILSPQGLGIWPSLWVAGPGFEPASAHRGARQPHRGGHWPLALATLPQVQQGKTQKPDALSSRRASSGSRGQDLNLGPSGYEPDELPGCSTPQKAHYAGLHWVSTS